MRQELDCAVSILTDGATTDELVVRPVTDSPKRHFDKLRSVLAKRGTGPATINHTFSGIRGTVHAAWETWAGRRQDADRCHGRTERKSTTAPAASTMRRHRRSATLVRQTLPGPALHKRYPIKHAVPYDGVVDSVRGVQRGDLLQRLQFGAPEVHHHERQGYYSLGNRSQQRFLKPVRLALYTVDQHAPHFPAVDAASLEHVPWRPFAFGWIGGREQLVPCPTGRLQAATPPDRAWSLMAALSSRIESTSSVPPVYLPDCSPFKRGLSNAARRGRRDQVPLRKALPSTSACFNAARHGSPGSEWQPLLRRKIATGLQCGPTRLARIKC